VLDSSQPVTIAEDERRPGSGGVHGPAGRSPTLRDANALRGGGARIGGVVRQLSSGVTGETARGPRRWMEEGGPRAQRRWRDRWGSERRRIPNLGRPLRADAWHAHPDTLKAGDVLSDAAGRHGGGGAGG